MTTIEASIDLNREPHEVWTVLTDFDAYPAWNPFISKIDGQAKLGEKITAHIAIVGHAAIPVPADIVTFSQDRELVWRSHLLIGGIFDRDHIFRIDPKAGGCTLIQTQKFSGPIAPLAGMLTTGMVRYGLSSMNDALKRRLETLYGA